MVDTAKPKSLTWLNMSIFVLAILLLTFVCMLLSVNLYFQYHNYSFAIDAALKSSSPNEAAIISVGISRAFDFAVVKTSATFLGFVLVIFGAAFVLRVAETAYSLDIDSAQVGKISLQSTSPGLVIATLGVLVIALSLYKDAEIEFDFSQIAETDGITKTSVPKVIKNGAIRSNTVTNTPTLTPIDATPICPVEGIDLNDSAKLSKTIDSLVTCLKANPSKNLSIQVTLGNKLGIKPAMSQMLSERKTSEISQMLIKKGISPSRLILKAKGETADPDNGKSTNVDTVTFGLYD